jgi:phage gpG-like protein
VKYIQGLDGLTRTLERVAIESPVAINAATGFATRVLYRRITGVFGDQSKLAELSPYTQEERSELGYTPNDPLLRDGSMLRDSLETEHLANVGRVGSAEPILAYHENGYLNARTGTSVPPRPVFQIGLKESKVEIVTAFEDALAFLFGDRPKPPTEALEE